MTRSSSRMEAASSPFASAGVEHTIAPEFLYQSLGDAKDTTPCIFTLKVDDTSPTCDILTHQNNTRIAAHLQPHCFVDRLSIGQLTNCNSHDVPPSVSFTAMD